MISFKGRHHQQDIILQCVRWYVAYSLSYRDLEELMQERGYVVDHNTIQRWVIHYAPRIELWRMLKKGQSKSSLPAWEQFYALALTG
jgi:transposase-like protein